MLRKRLIDLEVDEEHHKGGYKEGPCCAVDGVAGQVEECALPRAINLYHIAVFCYLEKSVLLLSFIPFASLVSIRAAEQD